MKRRLNYAELTRLDTFINKNLKKPLLLVRHLRNKTISQITTEALTTFLGAELEIIFEEMNPGNDTFKDEVLKYLRLFERIK